MVPAWQRGAETGEVTSPVHQTLALAALGGSVATPDGGLEGEIVRVASLEELAGKPADAVRGRIVFIDQPTARTSDGAGYGAAGHVRSAGPSAAAKLGATGLLIRSIGTDDNRLPHTGGTHYDADVAKIPAAALSAPDAALLTRLVRRGPVRVRFTLGCRTLPDAESANVIGEIPGRERPQEIVLLGAHLDSWDLGTGAIDDAAGCGIVIEAARQIGLMAQKPRRTIRVVLFANEENGLKGGKAYAEAHAAELASHVAALEADLGQGPPLGFSWNAGPSADTLLKAAAGPARADRRRHPHDGRHRRRRPHLPAAVGDPEPGAVARRDPLLRLSPHGQRQLRPNRSEDHGPVDGRHGDARVRARGIGREARADPAGKTGPARVGPGPLSPDGATSSRRPSRARPGPRGAGTRGAPRSAARAGSPPPSASRPSRRRPRSPRPAAGAPRARSAR